jgi:hypothetical protein
MVSYHDFIITQSGNLLCTQLLVLASMVLVISVSGNALKCKMTIRSSIGCLLVRCVMKWLRLSKYIIHFKVKVSEDGIATCQCLLIKMSRVPNTSQSM